MNKEIFNNARFMNITLYYVKHTILFSIPLAYSKFNKKQIRMVFHIYLLKLIFLGMMTNCVTWQSVSKINVKANLEKSISKEHEVKIILPVFFRTNLYDNCDSSLIFLNDDYNSILEELATELTKRGYKVSVEARAVDFTLSDVLQGLPVVSDTKGIYHRGYQTNSPDCYVVSQEEFDSTIISTRETSQRFDSKKMEKPINKGLVVSADWIVSYDSKFGKVYVVFDKERKDGIFIKIKSLESNEPEMVYEIVREWYSSHADTFGSGGMFIFSLGFIPWTQTSSRLISINGINNDRKVSRKIHTHQMQWTPFILTFKLFFNDYFRESKAERNATDELLDELGF